MKGVDIKKKLLPKEREALLGTLQARFEKNMNRHKSLDWAKMKARLEANSAKLWSLHMMETTGGEPDVVGQDKKTGEYIFFDCSAQTPSGRVSFCYDNEALEARKEHRPKDPAVPKHLGHSIGGPAVLPWTTAGHEPDVAARILVEKPGIILVGHVVDRVIEVEVLVVHPVHGIAHVVDARQRVAALYMIGML